MSKKSDIIYRNIDKYILVMVKRKVHPETVTVTQDQYDDLFAANKGPLMKYRGLTIEVIK